jgi:hypothetical protein
MEVGVVAPIPAHESWLPAAAWILLMLSAVVGSSMVFFGMVEDLVMILRSQVRSRPKR